MRKHEKEVLKESLALIMTIKGGLPLRSRKDEGLDINLRQIHLSIDEFTKKWIK